MKKSLHFFLIISAVAFFTSCGSTKLAKENSPAGQWDYTIQGTPQGDFSGIMTISKTDDGYSGQLATSDGVLPFSRTLYIKDQNKIEAEFDYSGMAVSLVGNITGVTMTGSVTTSGYEFPLAATKKN